MPWEIFIHPTQDFGQYLSTQPASVSAHGHILMGTKQHLKEDLRNRALCCRGDKAPACHHHIPAFSCVEMTEMTDSHIFLLPNLVKKTFLYCCSQATLTPVSQEAMTSSWPQLAHSLFIKVQFSFASLGNSWVSLWGSFNTTSPP